MSRIDLERNKDFEFKSFALYSEVAQSVGCTANQVDAVYSWYMNSTLDKILKEDNVQVFLKGLGTIKIDFGRGLIYLKGYLTTLSKHVNWYLEKDRASYLRLSYLESRHKILRDTIETMKRRIVKYKEIGAIKEAGFMNKLTRLEQLENQLNTIYESIQRIPEYEQKRAAECGQSASRSDEQSSEYF